MSSRLNSHFLFASVNEFISAWALGGTASLSLTTFNGQATVGYNCTLGHPGAPHFSTPSSPLTPNPHPPPRRLCHRGPVDKEKNRQRAGCHQAAMASPAPPTAPVPPPPTVSVASAPATVSVVSGATTTSVPTAPVISPTSKHSIYKCDLCEFTSMSKQGVGVH